MNSFRPFSVSILTDNLFTTPMQCAHWTIFTQSMNFKRTGEYMVSVNRGLNRFRKWSAPGRSRSRWSTIQARSVYMGIWPTETVSCFKDGVRVRACLMMFPGHGYLGEMLEIVQLDGSPGPSRENKLYTARSPNNRNWNIDKNFECLFQSSVWYKTEIGTVRSIGRHTSCDIIEPKNCRLRNTNLQNFCQLLGTLRPCAECSMERSISIEQTSYMTWHGVLFMTCHTWRVIFICFVWISLKSASTRHRPPSPTGSTSDRRHYPAGEEVCFRQSSAQKFPHSSLLSLGSSFRLGRAARSRHGVDRTPIRSDRTSCQSV